MDLLEQVLSRFGLANRPAPTLDGLQTLYAAWCRKVPFGNVRKLTHLHSHAPGPLPGDDPAEFLDAWLALLPGGDLVDQKRRSQSETTVDPAVIRGKCTRAGLWAHN
jgi:hypothetical protein